jgi:enediyne polyketide synthase
LKNQAIAIVGMACRYPDASTPADLWNNVLAQRKAFRRIPAERLNLEDYWSSDPDAVDSTYVNEGAFLANYEFDRLKFRVSGDAYRASDMAHWLALDVAADTLADAGFRNAEGLPKSSTGVYLGNTLTGETSRALVLRQRWPYVRRVLAASLADEGYADDRIAALLEKIEATYKDPFPAPGPESLVGGLANTIAGRICNFFHLQGGGYVVDGACASSLLAVAQGCSALASGDVDAALAGGVDISIDPFELVGFARVGALAHQQMRVYDKRSAGFLPGEGCGLVLLMREADALAAKRPTYALIRGWGISSDGAGSMTRPEVNGQTLALERAYRRAGLDISAVGYFEGHGTGTEIGDLTELTTIGAMRRRTPGHAPAVIGSIKANIGHTKAAAGAASLIKATLALRSCVLPPTTGCDDPHTELTGSEPALRVLREPEPWPAQSSANGSSGARFAAVSAMGFGGINTHIVLEEPGLARPAPARRDLRTFASSPQDAELFVFGAADADALIARLSALIEIARQLSLADMTDAAAALQASASGPSRAALVAATPLQLFEKLLLLRELVESGVTRHIDSSKSVYLSSVSRRPRIGLLFPGQAAPVRRTAGALGRRFAACERLYREAEIPAGSDTDTSVAQPAVVTASLSALSALEALGVSGDLAVGHSLGEIAAVCWAGAIDRHAALRLARLRGQAMASHSRSGSMATIAAAAADVESILTPGVVIAAANSPHQTVVSGDPPAVSALIKIARARRWHVSTLPVAHAFHSPSMTEVAGEVAAWLENERFRPLERPVYSTVSGGLLPCDVSLPGLLTRQITQRVAFQPAVSAAAEEVDLFIEAGPGTILSGLVSQFLATPAISLDAGSESHRGLLNVAGAAFALGASVQLSALFEGRFSKPFAMSRPTFLANPCESAPRVQSAALGTKKKVTQPSEPTRDKVPSGVSNGSPFEAVRTLIAHHLELPPVAVREDHRLFSDLHLNSIAVAQIVAQAARELGAPAPVMPTGFANATVATLTEALLETGRNAPEHSEPLLAGLASWVRCFAIEWIQETGPAHSQPPADESGWRMLIPSGHPLNDALLQEFSKPGSGVVVCVPPGAADEQAGLLLDAARMLRPAGDRFVLLHHGDGSSGFARSLRMEYPRVDVGVIRIPVLPGFCSEAYLEALSARGFQEVWYDEAGARRVPRLRFVPVPDSAQPFLSEQDVLLASGGGKGIGAECALALTRAGSARLLILGRSAPENDAELAQNLNRISAAGIRYKYLRADIGDRAACAAAVREGELAFGKVTAILHAAGRNVPALLESLDENAIAATVAPKVDGLRNLLAAVSPESLRLLLSFGSIIGRMGMRGNADYALANERLRQITGEFAAAHPSCRCLTLEWSLWSGVGMGERLGRIESLAQEGISPISPEQGTAILQSILAGQNLPSSLVVASRFKNLPELLFEQADPPLLRFLERTHLFVPGVELIAEARLSLPSDPYLNDHVFERTPLLPAVMGMEAMAQAAAAVSNGTGTLVWSDVAFERPVTVSPDEPASIRVYATADRTGSVMVALRAEQTGFQIDHFRGKLRFEAVPLFASVAAPPDCFSAPAMEADSELYGKILFQSGRFQRLLGYSCLSATSCRAHLKSAAQDPKSMHRWFGTYYPSLLLLGDPGIRDAAIHAIQACIPHRTVLPTRVEEIRMFSNLDVPEVIVQATERSSGGGTFVYDLDLLDSNGRVLEQWRGLVLRAVSSSSARPVHALGLIGPYLERRLGEIVPQAGIKIAFRGDSSEAASMLKPLTVTYRVDGKPEVYTNGDQRRETFVSAAHNGRFRIAVSGNRAIGCDLERIVPRGDEEWRDLLGAEHFAFWNHLSRESREPAEMGTRLWSVRESLTKLGIRLPSLLRVSAELPDGWMEFAAQDCRIQTCVITPDGEPNPLVFAIAH